MDVGFFGLPKDKIVTRIVNLIIYLRKLLD